MPSPTLNLCALLVLSGLAHAHLAAFHKAMYCFNGTTPGQVNYNTEDAVTPLWNLKKSDYWFHHINKCDEFPPAPGDFLNLPAGGSFTVEIASNRGLTSLSDDGAHTSEWPDGKNHPDDYSVKNLSGEPLSPSGCIRNPNIHAQNQSMAAGTAFAISYESDLSKVTLDNLVVFSVRYHTPWKRLTTYDVPAAMPACPEGGCTCAWVWIPNGCGEPNIYMQGFKCSVTPSTSVAPLAISPPKPPVYCADDPSKCVAGAKQIMIWNQAEGNNIVVEGFKGDGEGESPGYNMGCGFKDGAQNDIFAPGSGSGSGSKAASPPPADKAASPAPSIPAPTSVKRAPAPASAGGTAETKTKTAAPGHKTCPVKPNPSAPPASPSQTSPKAAPPSTSPAAPPPAHPSAPASAPSGSPPTCNKNKNAKRMVHTGRAKRGLY
ncbi:hypothetical protein HYDPIDRAFT_118858 [Hydnomerulius pinastri MD-312]|uniref:Lytic polysaccharide monooxygenase n=1 Tax=Hydnomerulius pinastri MD-312 TaxID=994086 RepID=A0A0C9W8L4_9AGAM|nr:hypothetical protein HYDPIDRAFT_118858 [Hydnomerulius pinastri MD-312]